MNRRAFLRSLGWGVAGAASAAVLPTWAQGQSAGQKPNILFIMTDDHAAHAISAYGSRINRTPNIDRIAREGALFDHVCVTNSICTPSRACILTGLYSAVSGVWGFSVDYTSFPTLKTIGGVLKDQGYYTALLGKVHMGGGAGCVRAIRDADWTRWMIYDNQGDYRNPFFYSREGYYPAVLADKVSGSNSTHNSRTLSFPGEYATENMTQVTKAAVDEALAEGKPFFVMMLHKAPHRNWIPNARYKAEFRKLTLEDIPPPDTLFDDFAGRASPIRNTAMTLETHMRLDSRSVDGGDTDLKLSDYFCNGGQFPGVDPAQYQPFGSGRSFGQWPEEIRDDAALPEAERERRRRERIRLSYLRYMQEYLACVQSVDDSVGEMLDYLKEKGIDGNTLVIYTSDQGFFLGDHGLYDKRFMMEESLKMPFLMRWPGHIAPGTVNRDIITNVDFTPTLADAAGVPQTAWPQGWTGRSFLPNVTSGTPEDWPQAMYYRYFIEGGEHQTPAHYGIRTQTRKLVKYYRKDEANRWELFDLEKDPEELHNVYADPAYAGEIEALKTQLEELKARANDTLGDDSYLTNG